MLYTYKYAVKRLSAAKSPYVEIKAKVNEDDKIVDRVDIGLMYFLGTDETVSDETKRKAEVSEDNGFLLYYDFETVSARYFKRKTKL